jgi:DNA-binding MarR family transcriptional regulator
MTSMTAGLSLDDQLCFALYSASRAVTARYRPLLEDLGVTYPQYLVLLVLWEEGPTTVRGLGSRLHLDSGTLSPLLKRLEAAGYVTRRRRVEDERSVEIGLTSAGEQLRDKALPLPGRICEASGLDPAAAMALTATLRALTAHVQADLRD